jgi:hypothetical protein
MITSNSLAGKSWFRKALTHRSKSAGLLKVGITTEILILGFSGVDILLLKKKKHAVFHGINLFVSGQQW